MAHALRPWVAMWRAAIPRFTPDSLRPVGRFPALRGGYVQSSREFYPPPRESAAIDAVLGARDPSGRYELVIDWYQGISEHEGRVYIGGEPDSSPLLIDIGRAVANQFEFCGTACGYQWGCWIDSTRFVLGGWSSDDEGTTVQGRLGIYSLADSSQTRFITPAVAGPVYAKVDSAWCAWVTARYRAWKASRAGH